MSHLDDLLADLPVDPVPLDAIRRDAAAHRRRRTLALTGIAAASVLAVTGGVAVLTGVTDRGPDRTVAAETAAQRELADAGGQPCPDVLPQAQGSDGFGTTEPAPDSTQLPDADQGWVCRYSPEDDGPGPDVNGSYVSWRLSGEAVTLDPAQLDALDPALTPFELQEGEGCTEELGPRWLLVTSDAGDLTGVAVDDFGCRNVRITDHPAEVEPGEATQPGTVTGVLEADDGFVEALSALFDASVPIPEPTSTRLEIEMGHCYVEPVDFDGEQWNVPLDDQFGWGGLEPKNWQGSGVMTRVSDDEARFDDDGGASVRFLLVDDPAVTSVEEAVCM